MKNIPFLLLLPVMVCCLWSQDLHIVYTGNLDGNLEACDCQGNESGGMVRVATAIDLLRRDFPDLILLDSGDFLKSYPLPDYNYIMAEFMKDLNYSALGIGDQEFVEGIKFFHAMNRNFPMPLVCSNMEIPESFHDGVQPQLIISGGQFKVGILSVIDPRSFDFISIPGIKLVPMDSGIARGISRLQGKVDLLILLCHSSYRNALELREKFPKIAVIIAGHTQERYENIGPRQVVLQAGYDGETIGLLTVHRRDGHISFEHQFIPVNSKYSDYIPFKKKMEIENMKYQNQLHEVDIRR